MSWERTSEVENRMLDEMINKGVAEDQYIRQITREVKGGVGKTVGQVKDILDTPFSWREKLNRKSGLAMFRVKLEKYSQGSAMPNVKLAFRKLYGGLLRLSLTQTL